MRKLEIKGYGVSLPKNTVKFGEQTRYRMKENEKLLNLITDACKKALKKADMEINDIDCIVSTSSVGIQPIPCTAALIHEAIAKGSDIPVLDINTTCTGFITSLDIMSYMIEAKRYKKIMIVSGEAASLGLNPRQKESYELFSDAATAIITGETEKDRGIIAAEQKTWSEGAHSTEIRGGLLNFHPRNYSEGTEEEFMFDMKGKIILSLSKMKLPVMLKKFLDRNGVTINDIDMVIPHQASSAMPLIMKKLGVPENKYVNIVAEYGNMVSASVPFALCKAIETGKVKSGNTVLLIGTAAGLTTNLMLMKM